MEKQRIKNVSEIPPQRASLYLVSSSGSIPGNSNNEAYKTNSNLRAPFVSLLPFHELSQRESFVQNSLTA